MGKFEETTRQLRISFTKKLSLDCPTGWTSTCMMFGIAICYNDVFLG